MAMGDPAKRFKTGSFYHFKKGCTGKVWYFDPFYALMSVDDLYEAKRKEAQVYKCSNCSNYHVTTSKVRRTMACPVLEHNGTHLFTLRILPSGITVASCEFCGVRIDYWFGLHGEERRLLLLIARGRQDPDFKQRVCELWGSAHQKTIVLNEEQAALVSHLMRHYVMDLELYMGSATGCESAS